MPGIVNPNQPTRDADSLSSFWADLVARWNYGTIPSPGAVPLPAPAAPQTEEELRNWTPEDMYAGTAAKLEDWAQQTRDAIKAAEASGSYRPEGLLGMSAETLGYVLAGVGIVAGVLILQAIVRR